MTGHMKEAAAAGRGATPRGAAEIEAAAAGWGATPRETAGSEVAAAGRDATPQGAAEIEAAAAGGGATPRGAGGNEVAAAGRGEGEGRWMAAGRRRFLKQLAATAGAAALSDLMAQVDPGWKSRIGLELYTVRDILPKDYEGTLAKVAEIGYKEVEAADAYNNMEPRQYRALLDKHGLSMPSTHSGATDGPNLEKQLEGFQIMGLKYTEVLGSGGGGGGGARTVESVKRSAAQLNRHGAITKKFGMKILVHNHAGEFERLEGSDKTQYDVLLAETDPALVAMQLDVGWACVAGQNVLEMFAKTPGRFELWHVKDAENTRKVDPAMSPTQRQRAAHLVPVGLGDVDYRAIFGAAKQAGLKHFVIEQDNAAAWGDSVAAARVSYQNLMKILS